MEQKWTNNLNNDEFNLIVSPWYPLLKKSATEKIKQQLHQLGVHMQEIWPQNGFKISLGENLNSLPYLVLDFPKIPGPHFPFVFRTLFWWGKGIYFQAIISNEFFRQDFFSRSEPSDFIYTGAHLWENDLSKPEYKILATLNAAELALVQTEKYIKIVRQVGIKKTDALFNEAIGFYTIFSDLGPLSAK